MTDIHIRKDGHAGRITLDRPKALNALTWEMCLAIEKALDAWRDDPEVALLIIDATGDKAFCAGGDIQEMYDTGTACDFTYGERFWRDEYRMNAKLFHFPKPVVTLMQGFTMGGGVGVACHGSHRIVCETSKVALPEVSIGLVADVGGSLILARAPGRVGEFLGLTGDRMDAGDAIFAGFADYFVPRDAWAALVADLVSTGDWNVVDRAAQPAPPSRLSAWRAEVDSAFAGEKLGDIWRAMPGSPGPALAHAQRAMARNSPLSMACTLAIIRKVRSADTIETALDQEFRFTSRAMKYGDFLEGIRAAIIDRDNAPNWRHPAGQDPLGSDVLRMSYPTDPPLELTGETP